METVWNEEWIEKNSDDSNLDLALPAAIKITLVKKDEKSN